MLLSIIRYIRGYLKIRVIGYSPERFLNACCHRGIYIWGITPVQGSYDMYITVSGFRKLKPVIKKTGAKVMIRDRIGLPFYLFRYRKRKVFFGGAILSMVLIYFLSLFVWSIDVRGNRKYTDEALISFLEEQGVVHGMRLSKVDCDRIVKDIRKSYDEIIWVSASIDGCRLIVQIKENEDSKDTVSAAGDLNMAEAGTQPKDGESEDKREDETVLPENGASEQGTDLVADFDGVITKMIVRKGIPCVAEGQQVSKGEILVTGAVPVMDDAGETIGYQFQQSEADIQAQVTMEYHDSCEPKYEQKEYLMQKKEELYFQLGNTVFWLGNHRNRFSDSEELTTRNQLRIGAHFYLPVSWGKRITRTYSSRQMPYDETQLQTILSEDFQRYEESLEKKGVAIIENNVRIYTGPEAAEAKGTLTVITDIASERPTSMTEEIKDGDDRDNN